MFKHAEKVTALSITLLQIAAAFTCLHTGKRLDPEWLAGCRHSYTCDGRIQEREGFEPSEPVKALQFSRLLH